VQLVLCCCCVALSSYPVVGGYTVKYVIWYNFNSDNYIISNSFPKSDNYSNSDIYCNWPLLPYSNTGSNLTYMVITLTLIPKSHWIHYNLNSGNEIDSNMLRAWLWLTHGQWLQPRSRYCWVYYHFWQASFWIMGDRNVQVFNSDQEQIQCTRQANTSNHLTWTCTTQYIKHSGIQNQIE